MTDEELMRDLEDWPAVPWDAFNSMLVGKLMHEAHSKIKHLTEEVAAKEKAHSDDASLFHSQYSDLSARFADLQAKLVEAANIALAIDSGRGNEKEIAKAIGDLSLEPYVLDGRIKGYTIKNLPIVESPAPRYFSEADWKRIPLKLRQRWWAETGYGNKKAPSKELMDEMNKALGKNEPWDPDPSAFVPPLKSGE